MSDSPSTEPEDENTQEPNAGQDGADEPASSSLEHGLRDDEEDAFPSLDELIGTFFGEPSLLPIVIVILLTGGAFGAALLILTGLDRNPFAAGALILITGMTVDVCLQARKKPSFRNLALLIGMVWGASALLAILALWSGIAFG